MSHVVHQSTSAPHTGDAHPPEAFLDLQHARQYVGFWLRTLRRRWRLAASVFATTLAMAVLALVALPRSYHVETRILAQRNVVLPMLSNPRRTLPAEADTPTRLAAEAVMNHENLVAIIKQTNLVEQWDATRPPMLRAKDWARRMVRGPMSAQDRIDGLVGTLERRMWVRPGEGTVTIGITWPDPAMAYRVVLAAQQNFIEERHAAEVSTITESIAILETHANRIHGEIRTILDDMGAVRRSTLAELPRSALSPTSSVPIPPDARVMELQRELATVRQTIGDLEQFRSRRLVELQATLAAQRSKYGPAHPQLEETEQGIRALTAESPQLGQLRQREQELLAQLERRGARAVAVTAAVPSGSLDPLVARAAIANLERARTDSVLEERQTYGRSRLKIAVDAFEDLLGRLEAARIELETTRAAFKYRYGIIAPPQVPKRPMKPRPVLLLGGGLVLGTMLALFAVVVTELAASRVMESWQIERSLGLPVLGEATVA